MKKQKVLIVEDDAAIREGIADALKFEGFAPIEAADGKSGLEAALTEDCELILLDLILPGPGGLEILKETRKSRPTLPVIILTARGEEADRVAGLKLGADDYVVKPFSIKELMARVAAVLRRSPERPGDVGELEIPGGKADLARREVVFKGGKKEELSEREAELLRYLAASAGRAVSRDEILQRVWQVAQPSLMETRAVDMTIARLREKLGDDAAEPKIIATVRGKGYVFNEAKKKK